MGSEEEIRTSHPSFDFSANICFFPLNDRANSIGLLRESTGREGRSPKAENPKEGRRPNPASMRSRLVTSVFAFRFSFGFRGFGLRVSAGGLQQSLSNTPWRIKARQAADNP
jgi:hypothetical protein